MEAEAVLEGGNVDNIGATGKDKGDPPIRTIHSNQPCEVVPLIVRKMQELMARKLRKMITEAGGGGAKPKERGRLTEDGAKALKPKKTKRAFFFVNIRTPRKGKEAGIMPSATRGAASPWFTGAGSDLLVVK